MWRFFGAFLMDWGRSSPWVLFNNRQCDVAKMQIYKKVGKCWNNFFLSTNLGYLNSDKFNKYFENKKIWTIPKVHFPPLLWGLYFSLSLSLTISLSPLSLVLLREQIFNYFTKKLCTKRILNFNVLYLMSKLILI